MELPRYLRPVCGGHEQLMQRHIELHGDRVQGQDRWVENAALDPPDHVAMDTCQVGQFFLRQFLLQAPMPYFFAEVSQKSLVSHTRSFGA